VIPERYEKVVINKAPNGLNPINVMHFIIYIYIQGVTGGTDQIREGVPYVKLYRKTPKDLYPKLNGLGDNGQ